MKTTKIQPLGKNVLIKVQEQEKKTENGIFLPDTATEEKPQQGIVIAVGTDENISVKPQQKVIYNRYAGTDVVVDGEEYLIVKDGDILAVIG